MQRSGANTILSAPQYSAEYPPPPYVHWATLLIASIVVDALLDWLLPSSSAEITSTLLWAPWVVYLCLWIRKLDPKSKSLPLAVAAIGVELAADAIALMKYPSPAVAWLDSGLGIADIALWIMVIFVIRAELLKHYNEREPIGLQLGPVMTLFFSFLYFQYHLYDIAQFKKRQAQGIVSNSGHNLIS
jgi:hypothetical protein